MGGKLSKGTMIIGLVVLAFVAGFVALVVIDSRQQAGSEPPEGVEEFEVASADHVQGSVSYEQTPPVGGDHNNVWQNQGFYNEPVPNERAVHLLEHGAVWVTYSPNLSQEEKDQLEETVDKNCVMASPYPDLPEGTPVMASAWGRQIELNGVDDPNLERFITAYRQGPQTPEPGARCTGGTSDTA